MIMMIVMSSKISGNKNKR